MHIVDYLIGKMLLNSLKTQSYNSSNKGGTFYKSSAQHVSIFWMHIIDYLIWKMFSNSLKALGNNSSNKGETF